MAVQYRSLPLSEGHTPIGCRKYIEPGCSNATINGARGLMDDGLDDAKAPAKLDGEVSTGNGKLCVYVESLPLPLSKLGESSQPRSQAARKRTI